MTELLFLISSAKTGVVLEPLARACKNYCDGDQPIIINLWLDFRGINFV